MIDEDENVIVDPPVVELEGVNEKRSFVERIHLAGVVKEL